MSTPGLPPRQSVLGGGKRAMPIPLGRDGADDKRDKCDKFDKCVEAGAEARLA